jgi:hypothetical protein
VGVRRILISVVLLLALAVPTARTAPAATLSVFRGAAASTVQLQTAQAERLYATFLGGNNTDSVADVAVDAEGNLYVTGRARSTDFPTTPGAPQRELRGECDGAAPCPDAFVAKYRPDGTLAYATLLGGSGWQPDEGRAIAVDAAGAAYVVGMAGSPDFPVTSGAFQTTGTRINGTNAVQEGFVVKLDPSGTRLEYSTLLGGNAIDAATAVAADASGTAYVAGTTTSGDFPTTPGAHRTTIVSSGMFGDGDAFVLRLNRAGSALAFSTLLGGNTNSEEPTDLALDAAGDVFVSGYTFSSDFPVTPGALQGQQRGFTEGFVVKLRGDGSGLHYSALLNGSGYDSPRGIAVDSTGSALVAGDTDSRDLPVTEGAYRTAPGTGFVARLRPDGSGLVFGTYLPDRAADLAIDLVGNAYVVGTTASPQFPVTSDAAQPVHGGGACTESRIGGGFVIVPCRDAFVLKLRADGASIGYASFLGGPDTEFGSAIALDRERVAYVGGTTDGAAFPTTPNAAQPRYGGTQSDGFVVRTRICAACNLTRVPAIAQRAGLG